MDSVTEAFKGAEASLRLRPTNAEGWLRKAETHASCKQWRHAADAFCSCFELEPDLERALRGILSAVLALWREQTAGGECTETASSVD